MKKIKVLQIISGNDNGGGGEHVLNILKGNQECFSPYICLIGDGDLVTKCRERKVAFKYFDNKIFNDDFINYINNNGFDIVNFHGARAALFHIINKKKIKVKTCITVHSDFNRDFDNLKGIKKIMWSNLYFRSLKSFRSFLVVSDYLGDLLKNYKLAEQSYSVYNGVDTKKLIERKQNQSINNECFTFISIARFHPIKNHKNMILGFNKLIKEGVQAKLLLIGDGSELDSSKKLVQSLGIEGNIEFFGHVDNAYRLYNKANIGILTSFDEGGIPPLSVLEGFVFSKTTIISEIHNIKEFLGDNVFYIDPNDYNSIYDGMKKSINDSMLNVKGEVLKNMVFEEFSLKSFTERYYEGYKNILSTR